MLKDILTALRKGKELANAETWKNASILAGVLTPFLVSVFGVLHALGVTPAIDDATLAAIAGGVAGLAGLFHAFSTAATSSRVGLPAGPASADEAPATIILPPDAGG